MTTLDQAERDRITNDLTSSLFVEAGAGTGKTTSLVDRVTALIREGVPVSQLVVITFTRAAAAELRDRVRRKVTQARDASAADSPERARLETAVREIDFAAIQTIDSFALSMLRERPLDAGLPPVIEPIDEVQAEINFDETWSRWLDEQPEDEKFAAAIATAFRLGLSSPMVDLYATARQLHANYYLLADHDFRDEQSTPRIAAREIVKAGKWLPDMARFCRLTEGDRLTERLASFRAIAERLERVGVDSEDADWILANPNTKISESRGKQSDWDDDDSGVNACKSVKAYLKDLQDILNSELADLRRSALGNLLDPLKGFVVDYAETRRNSGHAEFYDMLTWAVDLLRNDDARAHFQRRYTHVLVDEFQDTDPLQVELARALTDRDGTGQPSPGALFVVGDPKQSIYRFRHADLPTLSRLRKDPHLELTQIKQNFRSNTALVDWVNHVFERWMDGRGSPYQAEYVGLLNEIKPPETEPRFGVHIAGESLPARRIDEVRRAEMADMARIAREIGEGRWTVRGGDETRPSRYGDLSILIPRRTALPLLERELDGQGVPYTTAGNSLIFMTEDVRDLLNALTAIDDPTDQVAVVAALRSPAYGCSDVDLWEWARAEHGFNYLEAMDDPNLPGSSPVTKAFRSLKQLHLERFDSSPGALIERFVRERRLRENAVVSGHAEERWARIRYLSEMARVLVESGRSSLREFVLWAWQQAEREIRAPDAGASEESDTVRVMTVHAAKGLEFPIVMLTGLNSSQNSRGEKVLMDHRDDAPVPIGVRMGSASASFESSGFDSLKEQEKNASKMENVRLMYVAATRAKDHLIVSTYRKEGDRSSPAALIADYSSDAQHLWAPITSLPTTEHGAPSQSAIIPEEIVLDDPDGWSQSQAQLINQMSRRNVVSASSLHDPDEDSPGEKSGDEGAVQAPWKRGRAASAIGRAVHAVLQDVDLSSPDGVNALARKHAAAHEVTNFEKEISDLANATLRTPVMRRAKAAAADGRAWRESYVSSPIEDAGAVIEGYVDLMFEEDDGSIVIVDYKTDRTTDAFAGYEVQLGAYASAIQNATNRKVSSAILIYSRRAQEALANREDPVVAQHEVKNLDEAMRRAIAEAKRRSTT